MISIIVTAYNVEKYIEDCVLSIVNQSYKQVEIIIIDDGSKDNTESICKKLISKYKHIKYLYQENSGVSVARNKGIEEANGDFIMFVDGDDKLNHQMLESLLDEVVDCELDVVCCCCNAFSDKESYIDYFFDDSFVVSENGEKEKFYMQLLNGNYGKRNGNSFAAIGVPWGKLYRRTLLMENNLRFNSKLRRMQDNVFNMYVFDSARKIKYINKPYYMYRIDHITSGKINMTPENFYLILEERSKFLSARPQYMTENIMQCVDYEIGIALTISVSYIVSNNKLSQAKQQFDLLRCKKIYKDFFIRGTRYKKITKHHLVIYALKYKMFTALYLLFFLKNR